MIRLSKRCEYGLKAAIRLANRQGEGYLQSRDIAQNEALPAKFLESILLALRSAQILESKVGAGGGYRLSRPADQISVSELMSALERSEAPSERSAEADRVTAGRVALEVVNQRIGDALSEAVGSLSLAELSTLAAEKSQNGQVTSMYYI